MPIVREQLVQFRVFDGIDLNVDSRTTNPRAWRNLKNLYGKVPGRLTKRPGSSIHTGTVLLGAWDVIIDSQLDDLLSFELPSSPLSNTSPKGIAGLTAIPLNNSNKDTLVGALSFSKNLLTPIEFGTNAPQEVLHDSLFYVDEDADIVIMEMISGSISSGGQKWSFAEWPNKFEVDLKPVFGTGGAVVSIPGVAPVLVAANRIDALMGLYEDSPGVLKTAPIVFTQDFVELHATKVQAVLQYNGSLILGGVQFKEVDTGDEKEDQRHFVYMTEVTNTSMVGEQSESSVRIGANENEPITALGLVTVQTDTQGQRGQLAMFTSRQLHVFDGFPLQITDVGTNFRNVINTNMGTISPNAVVQTAQGLVFLGTDGVVYVVRPSDRPLPIGRAIEPALKGLTPEQLINAAAVWDDGFYKLSVPEGYGDIPEPQYWADLRNMTRGEYDLGVKWSGRHEGQKVSVFATARGFQDTRQVYGGHALLSRIDLVSQENLTQDHITDIDVEAASPDVDLGDAHIEKLLTGVELGVNTNKTASIDVVVSALSARDCVSAAETLVEDVTPCGLIVSASLFVGSTTIVSSADSFTLAIKKPENRLRGRMHNVVIKEASDAKISFSDMTIRLRQVRRRN